MLKRVYFDVQKPYVYCRLTIGDAKQQVSASGFSKCAPQDKWDEATGRQLAKARALKKATARYLRLLETHCYSPGNVLK